jgi:hypothetical protein
LRIGLYEIEQQSIDYFLELVKSEHFSGGLIARNNSAYFLVGCTDEKFLYLDPHFIQDSFQENYLDLIRSYEVKQIQQIRHKEINPSVGIFFKLKSFRDCLRLQQLLEGLKEKYPEHYSLCFNLYKDFEF